MSEPTPRPELAIYTAEGGHQAMTAIVLECYEQFDAARRQADALEAARVELRAQAKKPLSMGRKSSKGEKDVA